MTVRWYSLANSQGLVLALCVMAGMLGFGLWSLFHRPDNGQPEMYRLGFWVLWASVLMMLAYRTLTATREIIVHENDLLRGSR